jgi:uncharacterized membrane protein
MAARTRACHAVNSFAGDLPAQPAAKFRASPGKTAWQIEVGMGNDVWPVILVALLLGGLTGLRTFTPITVLLWMLKLHHVFILGSRLYFLHNLAPIIIVTILAAGELIADKLPRTPSRLKPLGMTGRILLGAFCGWIAGQTWGASWEVAAGAGILGALLGAVAGYEIRKGWVRSLHWHDLPVALIEDLVCIGGSILVVSRALYLSY